MKNQNTGIANVSNPHDIGELDLSDRTLTILRSAHIHCIGDLANKTEDQLSLINGLGLRRIKEIKEVISLRKGYTDEYVAALVKDRDDFVELRPLVGELIEVIQEILKLNPTAVINGKLFHVMLKAQQTLDRRWKL